MSVRLRFGLIFLACVAAMICALFFQYVQHLEPCPLCITQRIFICAVGLVALLSFVHNPAKVGTVVYSLLAVLLASGGGYFAGRQLWLQSLPPEAVPACGPPLAYIMENFPILEALQVLIAGDGNCSEVTWMFLGLSMPAWVLIIFVGLAGFALSNVVWRDE